MSPLSELSQMRIRPVAQGASGLPGAAELAVPVGEGSCMALALPCRGLIGVSCSESRPDGDHPRGPGLWGVTVLSVACGPHPQSGSLCQVRVTSSVRKHVHGPCQSGSCRTPAVLQTREAPGAAATSPRDLGLPGEWAHVHLRSLRALDELTDSMPTAFMEWMDGQTDGWTDE